MSDSTRLSHIQKHLFEPLLTWVNHIFIQHWLERQGTIHLWLSLSIILFVLFILLRCRILLIITFILIWPISTTTIVRWITVLIPLLLIIHRSKATGFECFIFLANHIGVVLIRGKANMRITILNHCLEDFRRVSTTHTLRGNAGK